MGPCRLGFADDQTKLVKLKGVLDVCLPQVPSRLLEQGGGVCLGGKATIQTWVAEDERWMLDVVMLLMMINNKQLPQLALSITVRG